MVVRMGFVRYALVRVARWWLLRAQARAFNRYADVYGHLPPFAAEEYGIVYMAETPEGLVAAMQEILEDIIQEMGQYIDDGREDDDGPCPMHGHDRAACEAWMEQQRNAGLN